MIEAVFGPDVAGMPYYRCWEGSLGEMPVVVSARAGAARWASRSTPRLALRPGALGPGDGRRRAVRDPPIAPSDQRRLEAGIFNYGNDMTIENNPFEITGMERLVEFSADFIGKEALQRVAAEGVRRKLVGVEIGGEPFRLWLEDFWPVRRDEEVVGRLVSASYSFRLGKNIGYAWVPIELAQPGSELEMDSPDGPVPAETAALPFVDPNKDIPKERMTERWRRSGSRTAGPSRR